MSGNVFTVDSYLVPSAERCCTLPFSNVTSLSTGSSSPGIAVMVTAGLRQLLVASNPRGTVLTRWAEAGTHQIEESVVPVSGETCSAGDEYNRDVYFKCSHTQSVNINP